MVLRQCRPFGPATAGMAADIEYQTGNLQLAGRSSRVQSACHTSDHWFQRGRSRQAPRMRLLTGSKMKNAPELDLMLAWASTQVRRKHLTTNTETKQLLMTGPKNLHTSKMIRLAWMRMQKKLRTSSTKLNATVLRAWPKHGLR